MTTITHRGSAKIYQFPVKARRPVPGYAGAVGSVADVAAARLPRMEFGSGWYHDAAIEEDARDRKRDGH